MKVLRRALPALMMGTMLAPATASSEGRSLSLEEALALARERSPGVLAARARIEEARGRLTGASIRMGGNPAFEADIGQRDAGSDQFTELELAITQPLGVAGRRDARIAGAQAELDAARAESEEVSRSLLLEVAGTFLRAVHAARRQQLAEDAAALTEGIATSAERRFQAGDVAVIDVNVATTALARARSASLASTSDLGAAVGSLKMLLGLEAREEIFVRGELDRPAALELPPLLATARSRPDLIALEARIAQAEADARAGGTQGRPGFDVGLRYKQEAEDDIMMGLMTVSLPVFDRGQGTIAEANARAARLRLERDALRRAVETEVTAAFAAWQQRLQAAELIGQILPRVSETDALAGKSYEAGQIGLVEMLVLRRDAVETRVLHADRQLEAALAEVKLEASAGMLR